MKLIYSGAHPEVYVLDGDAEVPGLEAVRQGEPVEVPDELAKNLLAQSTWEPADKAAEKVAKAVEKEIAQAAEAAQETQAPETPEAAATDQAATGDEKSGA
jgi:hypothetical protein